ncbi:CDP-diacylglycerol--glycerol-3-phosphate 3-phosphatidyltransferase [Candidatus Woesearchaeota archaeon]|nr:CDP-diacylglycerol--glycerol-3-phosphate 3-phosphatidyltransferase [Candidatus Woesearchaeota archaeon]
MKNKLNLANVFTILRAVLAILVPFYLIQQGLWPRIIALILFTAAMVSDHLDGRIARKYNEITALGKIIDPIADKMLTLGLFSTFSYLGLFSWWFVIIIAIREITVTAARMYFLAKKTAIPAARSGKIKTILQFASLGAAFLHLIAIDHIPAIAQYTYFFMHSLLIIAVILTIYSGLVFFRNLMKA